MHIDLSTLTRRLQPAVILSSARKFIARQERVERKPRRERRYMNG